jgi:hypothetical protein
MPWPPSTPPRPGPIATPATPSRAFPLRSAPAYSQANPTPLPDLVRDDASALAEDPAQDSDPEAWTSEEDLPSPSSSCSSYRGRHPPRRPRRHLAARSSYISRPLPNLTRAPGSSTALLEISERLSPLIRAIETRSLCPDLDDQALLDFQYHVFMMVRTLSESGLLDCVFDMDPSGILRHQQLCALRDVLGRYYPSVACGEGTRAVPGPLDPNGPISSNPGPVEDLGKSFQHEVEDLLRVEVPPPISKTQARQQCRARAKLALSPNVADDPSSS